MNSGEALAAGVSVVDSSGGIGMEILTDYFVPIESQDENQAAAKHLYLGVCGHEKWQYVGHEKRIH